MFTKAEMAAALQASHLVAEALEAWKAAINESIAANSRPDPHWCHQAGVCAAELGPRYHSLAEQYYDMAERGYEYSGGMLDIYAVWCDRAILRLAQGKGREAAESIKDCVTGIHRLVRREQTRLENHPNPATAYKTDVVHQLAIAYAFQGRVLASVASGPCDRRLARKAFAKAARLFWGTTHRDDGRAFRSCLLNWAMSFWRASPVALLAVGSAVANSDWRHAARAVIVLVAGKPGENRWRNRHGRQPIP